MKYCESHWALTRKAIDDRRMGHLVSANGRDAVARISDLDFDSDPTNTDPLLSVSFMVYARAIEFYGIGIVSTKEDGTEYCPICYSLEHKCPCPNPECKLKTEEDILKYWIDGPADSMLKYCTEQELMN